MSAATGRYRIAFPMIALILPQLLKL